VREGLESLVAETDADELIAAAAIHGHSARGHSYEIPATDDGHSVRGHRASFEPDGFRGWAVDIVRDLNYCQTLGCRQSRSAAPPPRQGARLVGPGRKDGVCGA
jgi:hypothetical protein